MDKKEVSKEIDRHQRYLLRSENFAYIKIIHIHAFLLSWSTCKKFLKVRARLDKENINKSSITATTQLRQDPPPHPTPEKKLHGFGRLVNEMTELQNYHY